MYTLTLTREERKAFDWVGYRYAAGTVMEILYTRCTDGYTEWWDEGDITFNVPEHSAWFIKQLAEEEDCQWPCFATELKNKMNTFINQIV